MKICRVLLILSVLLFIYTAVLTSIMFPGIPCILAIAVAVAYRNRPRKLTAHGTAAWATSAQLAHLIEDDDANRGSLTSSLRRWTG